MWNFFLHKLRFYIAVSKLDFNDIERLMNDFKQSEMRELEITTEGFRIHLSKNETPFPFKEQTVDQPAVSVATNDTASDQVPADDKTAAESIKSPMVGSVFLQPKPGADPYVTVGSKVHKGDVVCIIEAMKMMTEIKSDRDGVITEVLVENEDLVEFDQPLFKVTGM